MARGGRRGRKKDANGAAQPSAATPLGHNSGTGAEEATRNANVEERRTALSKAMESYYQLDKDIAAEIEERVKPLREDKSSILKSLRERFQITAPVFRARYQSFRLMRQAQDANDDVTQDAIVELFEVCPVTGQASFAAALDTTRPGNTAAAAPAPMQHAAAPQPSAPGPARADEFSAGQHDPEAAWQLGVEARKASPDRNEAMKRCPYDAPNEHALKVRFEEGVDVEDYEIKRARGEARPSA